jgi:fatty-acyl-CoA synthase/long-chain acyl-CoA synthetase
MAACDVCAPLARPEFTATASRTMEILALGGTLVLPPHNLRAAQTWQLIGRAGVTRVHLVAPILSLLFDTPAAAPIMRRLPVLEVGASVIPMALRRRTIETFGCGLQVNYSANEAPSLTAAGPNVALATADTVGYPVPDGEFEIVDPEGRAAREGVVGQVRARNAAMVSGYHDDPEADRGFFRNGWFYPGDLACWSADGQVIFKGRADDMMIFDGINIYPIEIENCLTDHPAVIEAIAFPVASPRHGQLPAAAVRVRSEVTVDALIGYAKERLGVRRPRKLVITDDFPRTATGKPLKSKMARLMEQAAER